MKFITPSDYDYAEAMGDPVGTQEHSGDRTPAFCVACQRNMTLLQAASHRGSTGHMIKYHGRVVTLGLPDTVKP